MDAIYTIGIIIFGAVAIYFSVLCFKQKGKITEELVETVKSSSDKVIEIAKSFLEIIDLNPEVERSLANILDIADSVVDYAIDLVDGDDKTQASVEIVNEVLGKIGINPNNKEQKMIQIVVEESIRQLDKKRL